MKFFVDTAEIKDIRDLYATGLLDGVTTNPSLVAKSGRDFKEVIAEICSIVPGPVSAEVAATDYEGMVAEGRHLAKIAEQCRGQGAAHRRWPQGHQDLPRRRHQDQRHALLLGQPGAARGQGRRDLYLALPRPPRRHQHRGHAS